MEWLEAALAFSVTMMILSTITTAIVELIHRGLRLREIGLRRILEQHFEESVWPKLAAELSSPDNYPGTSKAASKQEFVDVMTAVSYWSRHPACSPHKAPGPLNWLAKLFSAAAALLGRFLNERKLRSLTTLEFAERLAETEVGQAIASLGQQQANDIQETIINSLCHKFDDIGKGASDYFARQARAISMMVALILAFSLNVDAINLFQTYLINPAVRGQVAARGEAAAANLNTALARLNAVDNDSKPASLTAEDIAQLKQDAAAIKARITAMQSDSLPLSAAAATCHFATSSKTVFGITIALPIMSCSATATPGNKIRWFLAVLLGGFLIGLGGPFWFDAFKKLSELVGISRQLSGNTTTPADTTITVATARRETGAGNTTAVNVFNNAFKANALHRRTRPLLNQDGTLDRS